MTSAQQRALAHALEAALEAGGISVLRAEVAAGSVRGWTPVPAEGIIGRWLQNGWRVQTTDMKVQADEANPECQRHDAGKSGQMGVISPDRLGQSEQGVTTRPLGSPASILLKERRLKLI